MIQQKLSNAILLMLSKAEAGLVLFAEFYDNPRKFVWYGPGDFNKTSLNMAVSRLRQKGFVEKREDEGKIIVKLTEAGEDWVLKHQSDDQVKWDGIWRLVIFDIPESHRKVRNTLRYRLKEWGFKPWQKSVWATKKPLTGALRKLASDSKIDKWVLVLETSNVKK